MKTTLLLTIIILTGLCGALILSNKSTQWLAEDLDRDLAKCIEATGITAQDIQKEKDKKKQEEYTNNLEPIDIYSEEELKELYPVEDYIQPEPVCVRYEYYFSNEVCIEWSFPL